MNYEYEEMTDLEIVENDDYVGRFLPANMKPDLPLLRKEVEWVEEQARIKDADSFAEYPAVFWSQSSWIEKSWVSRDVCKTGCCLAGNVALMYGKPIFDEAEDYAEYVRSDEDGMIYNISDFARQKLGLNYAEADAMFHADNGPERIRLIAERVAARVGEKL